MAGRSNITERFGNRVRELRLRAKLSQEEFAGQCDLDRTYISGIERGVRNVALRNIERIAMTLRISLAELMRGV
jgi:transcriptional regulator with XRE-family HTH domain